MPGQRRRRRGLPDHLQRRVDADRNHEPAVALCDELVADTVDEFGQVDCLVNAAGVLVRGSVDELSDDDWRDTFCINLDVPFFLSRAALPHLLETKGSIANIASIWGLRSGDSVAAYCASKGGLVMLTRAMARDHAGGGLRVNAICPGGVDTPMLAEGADNADMDIITVTDDVDEVISVMIKHRDKKKKLIAAAKSKSEAT